MDLVWVCNEATAESPAIPGWLVARGLSSRGHRVSWVQRDYRDAPQDIDGVRLCPFPYDEREWPPGQGLHWGLVRLLGREIPTDAVIVVGGGDLPVAAGKALAERGMSVPLLWWAEHAPTTVPSEATVVGTGCAVPVPDPPRMARSHAASQRITLGALGAPADAVHEVLAALRELLRCGPGDLTLRLLTLASRDGLWEAAVAATGLPCVVEPVTLWEPGFDERRLWRVLSETDRYVSLGSGFDIGAAAALLAGIPTLVSRGNSCLAATAFTNGADLVRLLATDTPPTNPPSTVDHLRTRHLGATVLDAWEKVLR